MKKIGERITAKGERYRVSEEFRDETEELFKDKVGSTGEKKGTHLDKVDFYTLTHPLLRKMSIRIYPAVDYFTKAWKLPRTWDGNVEQKQAAHLEIGSSYYVRGDNKEKDIARILVLPYNEYFAAARKKE